MSTRRNQSLFQELREEINRIEVINSHEHQIPQSEFRKSEMNLFKLLMEGGYVGSDVISSGLPEDSLVSCNTPEDYWKKLKAYLPNVDNCFYFRCQLRAYRDLYNFEDDEITEDNWRSLSNKINQAYKRNDWARYVLKIRGNIYKSIVDHLDDQGTNPDPELYVHVVRMDDFIQGQCLANRQQLEQRYGQTIYSFDSYLNLLDTVFEKAHKDKVVGIKTALAYQRTLSYDNVSKHEAEKVFNKSSDFISSTEAKLFQDYMMHAVIQRTIKYTLPIQIHTGIQAGNGNVLSNSNPLHLANLFLQYRQGKFVLFHGGYPFSGEVGIMAMNFPNVYLDACWLAHPSILTINLHQWIELVPGNKILVWGGDCRYPEPTYGSLQFAKDTVAQVLTEKIERVYLSKKSAIRLAHNMFGDNAKRLFQIK